MMDNDGFGKNYGKLWKNIDLENGRAGWVGWKIMENDGKISIWGMAGLAGLETLENYAKWWEMVDNGG